MEAKKAAGRPASSAQLTAFRGRRHYSEYCTRLPTPPRQANRSKGVSLDLALTHILHYGRSNSKALLYRGKLSANKWSNLRSLFYQIVRPDYEKKQPDEKSNALELCSAKELKAYSRFTKNSIGDFMTFFSKTVADRTKPGQRQDVEEQSYTFHAYARSEGVAALMISNQYYPSLVTHQLLGRILDEFLNEYPV